MFSKRSRGPVPVQVVGVNPITKLEYYSKHGRNWFIALLVFSIIALILGALVLGGVIGYPTHVETVLNDSVFANGPILENQEDVIALLNFLSVHQHQIKDFINTLTPQQEAELLVFLEEALVTILGSTSDMTSQVVAEHANQANLETIATWVVAISSLTTLISIVGISVFSYLMKLDRPVSNKMEQKFYRQLEKAEYKAAIKTQKINKRSANKELKAKMKADFQSKKAK